LALAAGSLVLIILALIAVTTGKSSVEVLQEMGSKFFTSDVWSIPDQYFGSLALIYGTILTSVIALLLAVPVSLGIALFTTQVAPVRLRMPIIYVMDLLAVIPSVVFGLWGVLVLAPNITGFYQGIADAVAPVPVLNSIFGPEVNGKSFFTAGLILAIMITPIITSISREVIDTTPAGEREAALALGATKWEMIRGSVLPHSRAGLVGAVMLGLGRAMGETIAAALVIGSSQQITSNVFSSGDSMPAIIANQWGEADSLHRSALICLGLTLFVFTIVVNMAANAIVTRSERRSQGAV
jgi:phosphate transport system permease protein